jgi:hypothetical protein
MTRPFLKRARDRLAAPPPISIVEIGYLYDAAPRKS